MDLQFIEKCLKEKEIESYREGNGIIFEVGGVKLKILMENEGAIIETVNLIDTEQIEPEKLKEILIFPYYFPFFPVSINPESKNLVIRRIYREIPNECEEFFNFIFPFIDYSLKLKGYSDFIFTGKSHEEALER